MEDSYTYTKLFIDYFSGVAGGIGFILVGHPFE